MVYFKFIKVVCVGYNYCFDIFKCCFGVLVWVLVYDLFFCLRGVYIVCFIGVMVYIVFNIWVER